MTEIRALPSFKGNPQSSNQKSSDFWNGFIEQETQLLCISNA